MAWKEAAWKAPTGPNGRLLNSGGLEMSPRCDRFYRLLNERGMNLNTMSTDECVRGYMPKLVALRAELDEEQPASCKTVDEWDALVRDMEAIMRRTPQNRSA